jgi:SPP1 family predicted phage head-tail adaptor
VPRATWSALATMRAQLVEASADEFMRQGLGQLTERTVLFRTRFLEGVTTVDRVTYDGRIYTISGVKELGRRNGLEIRARALGAP